MDIDRSSVEIPKVDNLILVCSLLMTRRGLNTKMELITSRCTEYWNTSKDALVLWIYKIPGTFPKIVNNLAD